MKQYKQGAATWVSSVARPNGAQPQHSRVHAKTSVQPAPAVGQNSRPPISTALRTPAPTMLQAKMHNGSSAMQSRSIGCSSSGVVQAHVVGGNQALQARLNLWNTRLTRGAKLTIETRNRNVAQGSGAANGSRAIQRQSAPGVEAFRVPLRQKSGGLPLPSDVRAKMETAFGADFSDVRVHIGQEASSLGAIAYTWGTNIHFAPGQYNPHSLQGQKLLGHELWHVVQQKNGRVKNPFGGGVAVVQDHALEAEADRMGIKAALTQIARKKTE